MALPDPLSSTVPPRTVLTSGFSSLPFLIAAFTGIGDLLRLLLLSICGGSEHHNKKGKQQCDEIGVRDQPPFVVLVFRRVGACAAMVGLTLG